jgi:WD40 repeat protein
MFLEHQGTVRVAAYHPHRIDMVLTASADGSAYVWDPQSGTILRKLLSQEPRRAWAAWSPDAKWIATIRHGDTRPKLFQVEGWGDGPECADARSQDNEKDEMEDQVQISFSPDSTLLAVKHARGVSVWEVQTGKLLSDDMGEKAVVRHTWDPLFGREPDRNRLVMSRWLFDGVSVRDAHTMKHLRNLTFPGDEKEREGVWALAYSADGRYLLTGSNNGWVSLFDGKRLEPIRKPGGEALMLKHTSAVRVAAWSPDGRWLATGDMQGLRIWRVSGTAEELSIEVMSEDDSRQSEVCSLVWEPQGRYLAAGGGDGQLRIWECGLAEGNWRWSVTKRLEGHPGQVRSLSVSPDGKYIVAGGGERQVLVHPIDREVLTSRVADIPGRRELSQDEWERFLAEVGPRRPTWPRPSMD